MGNGAAKFIGNGSDPFFFYDRLSESFRKPKHKSVLLGMDT